MAANVFAYGTLLFPEVMMAVTGHAFAAAPATLRGFARLCVRDAVYPGAIEQAAAVIAGVLYRAVDGAALERLDRFEGDLYERRRVLVTCAGDARVAAEVYVVPAAHHGALERTLWEPELFRRDHLARYVARCRAGDVAEAYDP